MFVRNAALLRSNRRSTARGIAILLVSFLPYVARAQETDDIRNLKLKDWEPRSMLITKETKVDKPMFPVIDVHNHLGSGGELTADRVGQYLQEMNAAGVRTVVNLDGGWDDRLKQTVAALDEMYPGRFLTFALINFSGIDSADWSKREAERLERSFQAGAKGLKFHKSLGLSYRYADGRLMPIDDPKLDPIWRLCAKYKRPVMIHTADPAAFFTPLDRFNERWHELNEHPNWLFHGPQFPKREELHAQRNRVIEKNPDTTFIGAHFANNPEDLATVGSWLDKYSNLYVDIDARISELGRQPYTARKFFIKYQDRIMYGTDTTPRRDAFRVYYRFLETDDEYFNPAPSHHVQGQWMIYGLYLPREVLEKIYHKNAERVLYAATVSAQKARAQQREESTETTPPPSDTPEKQLRVQRTEDFEISGDGRAAAWQKVNWEPLEKRGNNGHPYDARVKMLYSDRGLYVLMDGSDSKLTATMQEDFLDLWNEDVYEFFLWPDEQHSVYFEYEISPLGYELPILVPNLDGKFLGWRPWHYEGDRKIQKATTVRGGEKKSGANIKGWTAEIFVPYDVLQPLTNIPPKPGTRWRANFYRVDYDNNQNTGWHWSPVGPSFHEYKKYGTLVFE